MSKPWIDVVTLDIPRGLLKRCLPSFLAAMKDRAKFRLRWLCHVDDYVGLEAAWKEECESAQETAKLFDDARTMFPLNPRGFGQAVSRVLEVIQNDVLWIEDDWDWTDKAFNLTDVMTKTKDCYSFVTPDTNAGSLHPTFYRKHVLVYLREHMPTALERFSETTSFRILRAKFEMTGETLLTLQDNHLGHKRMKELGFTHNWCGQALHHKRLHRPKWDSKKQQWIQQE